jgi:DNA-binding transcriptional regulator of glucitol operon
MTCYVIWTCPLNEWTSLPTIILAVVILTVCLLMVTVQILERYQTTFQAIAEQRAAKKTEDPGTIESVLKQVEEYEAET